MSENPVAASNNAAGLDRTGGGINILLIGIDAERNRTVARVLNDISERIHVESYIPNSGASLPGSSFRLAIVTDLENETVKTLETCVLDGSGAVLKLACLRAETVEDRQSELLEIVDDVLLHPEELELRLPFLEQRLSKRETREQQNRAILETIVDGIITIDSRGAIKSFNPAAERIFGYASPEVIGKNISVLMPEPHRSRHQSYIDAYEKSGRARIIGIGREVVGRRKNGELFPMDLAVGKVFASGEQLYTGVVRDVTERRELELEILRISDQERRRIGQDLHDGLGQMLTGIGLIAQSLVGRLEREDSDYVEDMIEVTDLLKEADRDARNLARGLVPVELDEFGLENALETLVKSVERLFDVQCTLRRSGTFMIRDSNVTTNLYRIAQESVSNAIKHGRAEHVSIDLRSSSRRIELIVRDDGVGFPDELPEERGMGVPIMKYRARVIGADLEIVRGDNGGTTISCILNV